MPEENRRTWILRPLRCQHLRWGERHCAHCGLALLTDEDAGFCCGPNGSRLNDVPAPPPLPAEFAVFLNSQDISPASCVLNLLYSFAALESTAEFPTLAGPQGFFAVQGRLYHRIRPNHMNSGIRWLLYDGYLGENAPFGDWIASLPAAWTAAVAEALLNVNPLAQRLRFLSTHAPQQFPHAHISIRDSGVAEIAAIMVYDNTAEGEAGARQLVVSCRDGRNQSIPTVSQLWEPLAYPLLFPRGTLGRGLAGHGLRDEHWDDLDAPTSLIWHVRARLLREPRFDIFGRLTNKYVVDMWTRELESRLNHIRVNQRRLRQLDAELMGEEFIEDNENVFLPASFLGSCAWASEHVADALAVAASLGVPTFFITVRCNPMWEEIKEQPRPGQTFADRPVVVARVFKQKLSQLLSLLNSMFASTGKPIYVMHTVEFHVHILVKYETACVTPEDIDSIISAEIPEDPADAELVRQYMLHTHPPPNCDDLTTCHNKGQYVKPGIHPHSHNYPVSP
ncbi:hypothetical protein FRC01_014248 [Tulasnella sp. 417]|nr:hypothetical protein FRC01_014248 [Tulasnella sp. 417]